MTTGVLHAANNRGLYRSADMGASWERLELPWAERHLTERVAGLAIVAIEQGHGTDVTE